MRAVLGFRYFWNLKKGFLYKRGLKLRMVVEINCVREVCKDKIFGKKKNIFMGISLGNKFFTEQNIKAYIDFGVKYSRKRFLILVADKIQAINYEVRNKLSSDKAFKRAILEGDKFEKIVKEIVDEFSSRERKKIEIIRWNEIEGLDSHKKAVRYFLEKFDRDKKFKGEILKIVENSLSWRFKKVEVKKLAKYVINELPEILAAFSYKGILYETYIYPDVALIFDFCEKIQRGEIFPEIRDNLKFNNMSSVKLNINKNG